MKVYKTLTTTDLWGEEYDCFLINDPKLPRTFVLDNSIYSNINANKEFIDKHMKINPQIINQEMNTNNKNLVEKLTDLTINHSVPHYLGANKRNIPVSSILFFTRQLIDGNSYLPLLGIHQSSRDNTDLALGSKVIKSYLDRKILNLDVLKDIGHSLEDKYLSRFLPLSNQY